MKQKFLTAVLLRSTDKIVHNNHGHLFSLWKTALDLLKEPDAIDDQAQAHGEGRLKR